MSLSPHVVLLQVEFPFSLRCATFYRAAHDGLVGLDVLDALVYVGEEKVKQAIALGLEAIASCKGGV